MSEMGGVSQHTVNAAIKLMEAAKRMGVASFSLNGFTVTFTSLESIVRATPQAVYDNPFDDPMAFAHLQQPR